MSGVDFQQAPTANEDAPTDDGPSMPPPRRWRRRGQLGPRSLTARISTGVVALVVVLVSAIGVTTYFALKPFLYDRLDQQVGPVAEGNSRVLDRCFMQTGTLVGCSISPAPGNYSAPETEWIVVVDDNGAEVLSPKKSTESVRKLKLAPGDAKELSGKPGSYLTVQTTDGVQVRVTARQLDVAPQLTVLTGLSTNEVRKTLSRLLAIELVIGSAAVLVALLTTLYGVRFGLRRLRSVTSTAREVAFEMGPSGTALERRVDVPDDGTEVGQLAESMNTMLSAVDTQFKQRIESEARLRQFLADASHELRTPLTSIRGYAELARMQKAAGADAEDNLSRIESEGTRMSRLVEDLLMLARGEQTVETAPRQELVDVADLVEGAARDTKAAWPNRDVFAEAAPGLQVIGDYDQLLRAVRNLAANAAVHTAPDKPIVVRSVADGDSVLIQVVDGGPGLAPEDASKVFERFWRADKARTRARGGTGLGMSIVAAIVHNHGGTVRFDSTVETGSTVTIRLPGVEY